MNALQGFVLLRNKQCRVVGEFESEIIISVRKALGEINNDVGSM